jgi:hypothetical protein
MEVTTGGSVGMGGLTKLNSSAGDVALVPADVVTVTSTMPGVVTAGYVATICDDETTVKYAAIVPNDTVVAPSKFAPEIVTDDCGSDVSGSKVYPLDGDSDVTVGAVLAASTVSADTGAKARSPATRVPAAAIPPSRRTIRPARSCICLDPSDFDIHNGSSALTLGSHRRECFTGSVPG